MDGIFCLKKIGGTAVYFVFCRDRSEHTTQMLRVEARLRQLLLPYSSDPVVFFAALEIQSSNGQAVLLLGFIAANETHLYRGDFAFNNLSGGKF